MTDRLGQQLGNYRLTDLLGQGGFAEVYQGEHVLLGTIAAIKVPQAQVSQEELAHFQQEARLLANLKHPHIVPVLDFGVAGQTPYLIMDYAPHGTLRTRHPSGILLPLPTVVTYAKQLAEALQYAHERKVVHRDVKPENMLIGERGQILLSGFGLALITQSSHYLSTQDEVIGTVAYMSPEQILGNPRAASDQYSLGIVLYEWLCGTCPFQGTSTELCAQHRFAPPPSLCDKVPTLSREVEQVVMTALAKDPKKRFENMRALACALEQASQGRLPTTTGNPRVSRRAVLIGGAGVVVLATAGEGVSFFLRGQSQPSQKVRTKQPTPTPTSLLIVFTYKGHSDLVNAVTWSPDGQRIASGSNDQTVQVWNDSDGKNVFVYGGHTDIVNAVAWSPDGQWIASGSYDNTVQVWNASDGSHVFTYKGHSDGVNSVSWSPDGQRIASGSWDKTVQVWNANDGSNVFTYKGHYNAVKSVAWSSDGQRIASGSYDNTVQVWNASDGSHRFTYKGHSDGVNTVAWSSGGQRIASGSDDKTVQVWNASDGSHVFIYKRHSDEVNTVAWSPNGQRITSGSRDNTVQVWHAV